VPAKFRVRITHTAEKDLEEVWDYIANDSPESAEQFTRRLEEEIETLETLPERCPLIPENEILGTHYRQLVVGHYRCVFRIAKTTVYMLRVIHGARLLDSSLLEA
jgi:toxin ParE1/3/4